MSTMPQLSATPTVRLRRTKGHGVVKGLGCRVEVHDVRHAASRGAVLMHVLAVGRLEANMGSWRRMCSEVPCPCPLGP